MSLGTLKFRLGSQRNHHGTRPPQLHLTILVRLAQPIDSLYYLSNNPFSKLGPV